MSLSKRLIAAALGMVIAVVLPTLAFAHNAGHLFLDDGTCRQVGSFRDAPLVGADRTQLDLVPQTPNPPRDEYGVSFVGFHGNTPIRPGGCPVGTPTLQESPATNLVDDLLASQPFNGV